MLQHFPGLIRRAVAGGTGHYLAHYLAFALAAMDNVARKGEAV